METEISVDTKPSSPCPQQAGTEATNRETEKETAETGRSELSSPEISPEIVKEAKRAALPILLQNRLKTDDDVRSFLTWLDRPVISTKVNCGHADHTAPFRFLADVLTHRVLDYTVWASRAGSKSYLAGLITWTESSSFPNLETTILGGSLEQSEKVYKALASFWDLTGLQEEFLSTEPTRRLSLWRNGSAATVLTASSRSVRGPHPQRLILDEIDEMTPDVYHAALSQTQSRADVRAGVGKFSTNHRYGGVMDEAVEQATLAHQPFYKWCIWDVMEPCVDYRCSTCPVSRFCPGEHMKNADGYYKVHDFAQKLSVLNLSTLRIEWFCEKVGRADLVYGDQYDEALHAPSNLPYFSEARPAYLSIDWGGAVFTIGVWQLFDIGWVRVCELYEVGTTNQRLIQKAKTQPWWKNVRAAVADPARDDLIREWKDAGIPIIPAKNDVAEGIEAVRNALRPVVGRPKFYINQLCKDWRREVASYREKGGKPVKEADHAMDETRYFVMWMIATKPKRAGKVYGRASTTPPPPSTVPVPIVTEPAEPGGLAKPERVEQNGTAEVEPGKPIEPTPGVAVIEPKGGFHVTRKGRVFGIR